MTVPAVERSGFAEASELVEASPGRFSGDLHPEWTIGGKPNGGYLLAMMGHAAAGVSEHKDPIAASAHYLSSPAPGPVVIEADLLRGGRSASQVRARMSQDGRACVEAVLTMSRLDPAAEPYWQGGLPAPGTVPIGECIASEADGPGVQSRVAILDQVEVRLEPASVGFARGEPRGLGEIRGWLRLPRGETFTTTALLFAVDAFPPATFDIELAGWVPTLELTAYVRAVPAPGPVQVLQKAQLIEGRRVDEACFVWDSRGRLVAQATQLAGIRLG
jgi:acyl-coenzyme A thioesterase PaaI-like protein